MRVALLGNLCNTAYTFAKGLRDAGIDAHVYITQRERGQLAASPEWEDPELRGVRVPWIHYYHDRSPLLLGTLSELRQYDLIHAFGMSAVYCQFLGRPFIAHALGADLKEVAYEDGVRGRLLRRAFRRAARFFFSDLDHYGDADIVKPKRGEFFPPP